MPSLKQVIYYIAKYTGLFQVARWLTADKLRILCYHGFSFDDEHLFRPKLYMSPALFEQRMEMLAKSAFPVLNLAQAVEKLAAGNLPPNAVVITVDDGWKGVDNFAAPVLEKHGFPWTLYLTTYYVEQRIQVINMVLLYLFWKSDLNKVDISNLGEDFSEDKNLDLKNLPEEVLQRIMRHADNISNVTGRQNFVRELGKLLNIDVEELENRGLFYLIDKSQAGKLQSKGVDLQLHTHRHTIGGTRREILEKEINDNLVVMAEFCAQTPRDFCYPSGYFTPDHMEWLSDMAIRTATTCNAGLNDRQTNPLALNRFLDGQNISKIEFEAELYGFSELLRKLKG